MSDVLGKFIVIEGIDGSGKTEATEMAYTFITETLCIEAIRTYEPGGSPIARDIRNTIKKKHLAEILNRETELLLMFAARSQSINNLVKPSLELGINVVCDRHLLSSVAYQGYGRGIDLDLIWKLKEFTIGEFAPDLTILLDINPAQAKDRVFDRGSRDYLDNSSLEFFERVRGGYLDNIADEGNHVIIDAGRPMDVVHDNIKQVLVELFKS